MNFQSHPQHFFLIWINIFLTPFSSQSQTFHSSRFSPGTKTQSQAALRGPDLAQEGSKALAGSILTLTLVFLHP